MEPPLAGSRDEIVVLRAWPRRARSAAQAQTQFKTRVRRAASTAKLAAGKLLLRCRWKKFSPLGFRLPVRELASDGIKVRECH